MDGFRQDGDWGPARMVNRVSISAPVPLDSGNVSASFIDYRGAGSERSQIVTVGYSRSLPDGGSLNAAAFADLSGRGSYGLLAAFMPLSRRQYLVMRGDTRQGRHVMSSRVS